MLTEALHHHDHHLLATCPYLHNHVCAHTCNRLPLQSQPALKMATAEFLCLKLKLMADILLGLLFLLTS